MTFVKAAAVAHVTFKTIKSLVSTGEVGARAIEGAMDVQLSRRGLFRALTARPTETDPKNLPQSQMHGQSGRLPQDGPDDQAPSLLAWISASCVEEKAVSCRRCAEACDVAAISYRPLGRGRFRAAVSHACVGCGECAAVCPVSAIALVSRERAALAGALAQAVGAST